MIWVRCMSYDSRNYFHHSWSSLDRSIFCIADMIIFISSEWRVVVLYCIFIISRISFPEWKASYGNFSFRRHFSCAQLFTSPVFAALKYRLEPDLYYYYEQYVSRIQKHSFWIVVCRIWIYNMNSTEYCYQEYEGDAI